MSEGRRSTSWKMNTSKRQLGSDWAKWKPMFSSLPLWWVVGGGGEGGQQPGMLLSNVHRKPPSHPAYLLNFLLSSDCSTMKILNCSISLCFPKNSTIWG